MANVVKRGKKGEPRFYVQYVVGQTPDGKRAQRMHRSKGVVTMPQAKQELARVERDLTAGRDPFAVMRAPEVVGPLLERFKQALTNRNAQDDRSRIDHHLMQRFGRMPLTAISLPVVMDWIDALKKTELAPQTQRHALNLLSRFFSWCIERGLADVNPVKMVPQGRRPVPTKREKTSAEPSTTCTRRTVDSVQPALVAVELNETWTTAFRTSRCSEPMVLGARRAEDQKWTSGLVGSTTSFASEGRVVVFTVGIAGALAPRGWPLSRGLVMES